MNYKIYIIISVLFILFALANIFTSLPIERGDNYYNILGTEGLIKYNFKPIGDYDIFQHQSAVILNHPPLFFHLWALILLIFINPLALNIFSIIFIILSAILLVKIIKLVYPVSDRTLMIIYFLFLFTPLIIQGSYLIDLDVILPFSMLLFVYFYLKNPKNIILNSLLFSLIWFTKIQGIPIIVLSLLLYLVFAKKSKKDYFYSIGTIITGSIIFFLLMAGYSYAVNSNVERMFAHSSILGIISAQLNSPLKAIMTSLWSFKQLIIWVIPSVFILYLLSIFKFFKEARLKDNKMILPILIGIITLLELIPISTYGWNFPKYYIEFVPFMFIASAVLIDKIKIKKKDIALLAILAIVFTFYFLVIPDPYIPEVNNFFTHKDYANIIYKVLVNFDLLLIPIIITFFVYKGWQKKDFYKALVLGMIILFISINIMQIIKPYSTNNLYGDKQEDLKATLNYLKENTNSTDKLLLFPHVGYYARNENNTNWYNSMLCYNSYDCMANVTANKDIKFMQFYPKDLERLDGKLKGIVEQEFKYNKRFGDYIIYKRI